MKIGEEKRSDLRIFTVSGKLDAENSAALERRLNDSIRLEEENIIVNLGQLDYISSAGLRVLLSAAKALSQKSRKIKIANLQEQVQEVFSLTGFSQIFEVFADLEKCIESFK